MPMIHTFSSTSGSGLFAFAGDADGARLPARHGPWEHVGRVAAGEAMPHGIDRAAVETAIESQGFQMWRRREAQG